MPVTITVDIILIIEFSFNLVSIHIGDVNFSSPLTSF